MEDFEKKLAKYTNIVDILKQNNITTIKEALNCKELWKKSNGVTLCIKCHKKTDSYLWKNNVNS